MLTPLCDPCPLWSCFLARFPSTACPHKSCHSDARANSTGIRTPWTIANERAWNATHRFAAKAFFTGGLLGLLAVILRAPFWAPITTILIAALVPAVYSLVFYKQLERRGEFS